MQASTIETPTSLGIEKESVAVLLPVFNRESEIAPLILSCEQFASKILVCDDGSSDFTSQIAMRLGAVVIKHARNIGNEAAIRTLFDYVVNDGLNLRVVCIVDNSTSVSSIGEYIRPIVLGECDITTSTDVSERTSISQRDKSRLRAIDVQAVKKITGAYTWANGETGIIDLAQLMNLRIKEVPPKVIENQSALNYPTNITESRSRPMSVDIILTAYNDELGVYQTVKEFKSHKLVNNVIVVDNNSHDMTGEAALSQGAVVRREKRQGYGYACIAGLKYAHAETGSDFIALCEGDGTFSAADLDKMLPYLEDVDMVVGSRTSKELNSPDSQLDAFYIWGNLFIAKLMQLRFFDKKHFGRTRFTDVGCTYRIVRRETLAKFVDDLKIGGHHFLPHMTMVAMSHGARVIEVPVTFKKRIGKSKGAGGSHSLAFSVGLKMIWHVILGR